MRPVYGVPRAPLAGVQSSRITALPKTVVSGGTAYDTVLDVDTPYAHWKLGSDFVDRIAARNLTTSTGATQGAATLVADNGASLATSFAGAGYAQRASSTEFTGSAGFSVEAWVKPTAAGLQTFVYKGNGSSEWLWGLTLNADNSIEFWVQSGGKYGYARATSATGVWASGGTYHVVGTYDPAAGLALYVNGSQLVTPAGATAMYHDAGDDSAPVGIGSEVSQNFLTGSVDEVAYYTTILNSTRVAAHYTAGTGGGGAVNLSAATGTATAAGGTAALIFAVTAAAGTATASGGTVTTARTVTASTGVATAGGGTTALAVTVTAATGLATAGGGTATAAKTVFLTAATGIASAAGGTATLTHVLTATGGGATATGGLVSLVGELYVATTGSDSAAGTFAQPFLTIGKAMTVVAPGGTVYVRGGVYNERVAPTASGTAIEPIVLRSYPGETAVIDGTGVSLTAGQALLHLYNVDYWQVRGFEIRDSTERGVVIDNCVSVTLGGPNAGDGNVIHDVQSTGVILAGDSITAQRNEVYAHNLANVNGLAPPWGQGISTYRWGTAGTPGSTNPSLNIQILDNVVHDGWGEGIDVIVAEATVRGNTLYNNYSSNIYLDAPGQNCIVERNYCYTTNTAFNRSGNPAQGILVGCENSGGTTPIGAIGVIIRNNLLVGCGRGIGWWNAGRATNDYYTGMKVLGNIVQGCTLSPLSFADVSVTFTQPTNCELRNNIINSGGASNTVGDPAGWTFSHNDWPNGIPTISGITHTSSLAVSPNYAGSTTNAGDNPTSWRLTPASTLIGAGVTHASLTNDYFGASRASPPSIGFSEGSVVLAASGVATAGGGTVTFAPRVTAAAGLATATGTSVVLTAVLVAATGAATAGGGTATASSVGGLVASGGTATASGGTASPRVTLTAASGTAAASGGTVSEARVLPVATGLATAAGGVVAFALQLLASGGTATADGGQVFAFTGSIPSTEPPLGGLYDASGSGGTIAAHARGGTVTVHTRGGTVTLRPRGGTTQVRVRGGDMPVTQRGGRVVLKPRGGVVRDTRSIPDAATGGTLNTDPVGGRIVSHPRGGIVQVRIRGGTVVARPRGGIFTAYARGGIVTLKQRGGVYDSAPTGGTVL